MSLASRIALLTLCAAMAGCDVTFNVHEPPTATPSVIATSPTVSSASLSESRPAWVDEPTGLRGGDYVTKVLIGPETDRAACEAKLPRLVEGVVADYVAREYGSTTLAQFDLGYSMLRSRIVAAMWEEKVTTGGEPGTFLHVQLRFDDKLRSEWKHAADRWTTTLRTYFLLKGLGAGMVGIFVVHMALRFGNRQRIAT